MEKAYDRVEWNFLWQTLKAFGFPDPWINWVRVCVTTVSYSIKINGTTTKHFSPTRGIRQGDPLSPYLFILSMEVFTIMLSLGSQNHKSGLGFSLAPRTKKIPCLLFVDDSLVLCKGTTIACKNLKKVIDQFCSISGQLVNFHKSAMIFSKMITNSRKDQMEGVFSMTKPSSLGRYMGAWFSPYKLSSIDYSKFLQKNEDRINHWHAQFLSKAGRMTLIQSNLEALPAHVCSSFLLPQKVCTKLDTIHRIFFWNWTHSKLTTPLISWNTICQPKAQGGIGLRKIRPLNQDFIAKLG